MAGKIRVDIISDTVCPWCFIGKRRLEKAISQSKDLGKRFEVVWHPYQLNPDAPKDGINKREFYQQKFGGRTSGLISNMTETFAREGLQYNMDGKTGNTLTSHRLIAHAAKQGPEKQNALVEELFKAYFVEGKFINDNQVLLDAAHAAGVADAEKVVEDESLEAATVKQEISGTRGNISGVPHFIIDNRYELSGAQNPAAFEEIFRRVATEAQ